MAESSNDENLSLLLRFLYLGDESKLFPQSVTFPFDPERTLFLENLIPRNCFDKTAIREILRVYENNYFLSVETIIYVLAVFAHSNNCNKKSDAFAAVRDVCKSAASMLTFTHLYKELSKPMKGWGRAHRRFLIDWYNGKEAKVLAAEVTKVKSRHKWSHKDVLCMAHVKAKNTGNAAILRYLVKGLDVAQKDFASESEAEPILNYLKGVYDLCHSTDPETAARLIEIHDLCLEHIPSPILKSQEVAQCMIPRMSLQHLLEQLPYFSKAGLLNLNSAHYKAILERLTSGTASMDSLGPLETFLSIRKWQISNQIMPGKEPRPSTPALDDALQNLHLASFKSVKPSEKHYLIALDVNLTMNLSKCAGCNAVTPSHVSDIILMALVRAETSNVTTLVFSTGELLSVDINNTMSLGEIVECLSEIPPGPAVLSAPINWALTKKMRFDSFVIFTDRLSHTQDNDLANVFKEYKETMHLPNSRYILSTLCDRQSSFPHKNPDYLNLIGFNAKLLKIIQDFTCCVF